MLSAHNVVLTIINVRTLYFKGLSIERLNAIVLLQNIYGYPTGLSVVQDAIK